MGAQKGSATSRGQAGKESMETFLGNFNARYLDLGDRYRVLTFLRSFFFIYFFSIWVMITGCRFMESLADTL